MPHRASLNEIEEFSKSLLWQDFCEILDYRIKTIQGEMESPDLTIEKLRRLQGELQGVRFWRMLPEELAKEAKRAKEKGVPEDV